MQARRRMRPKAKKPYANPHSLSARRPIHSLAAFRRSVNLCRFRVELVRRFVGAVVASVATTSSIQELE